MNWPQKILLVDDNDDGRAALSCVLRFANLDVEIAENGQIAYERAMHAEEAGHPFDVILMDMQMPVMDGFTATSLLREHGYRGRIIALTAMDDARHRCLAAGCDDFATKPIGFESLLNLVECNITPAELYA